MGPTTVSQIIEQIIRIVFLLAGSFIVIKVLGGTVATAVGVATFPRSFQRLEHSVC